MTSILLGHAENKRMIVRMLAWLLWQANADPPITAKAEFYAIKDRLLRRYGRHVGDDLQHIVKECWGSWEDSCPGAGCRRCGGTGIFDEFWVLLQRWRMGGYTFHRPMGRSRTAPTAPAGIEGYIKHAERDHGLSHEAALWLFLFYNRRTFRRLISRMRLGHPRSLPLSCVQAVLFEVRQFVKRLHVQRCRSCGRWTARWINACVFSLQCRRCESLERDGWINACVFSIQCRRCESLERDRREALRAEPPF